MPRESQYVDKYLDETETHRITPSTYLTYVLRGRAKTYAGSYWRALDRALFARYSRGEVRQVDSIGGGIAWVRKETS